MKTDIAKAVITAAPFSIRHTSSYPASWQKVLHAADRDIQNSALSVSDSFRPSDWQGIQIKKLKHILTHAGRSVPYWHTHFTNTNFRPETFERLSDVSRIPITTRTDIKEKRIEEFLSKIMPAQRRRPTYTSGSTGEPLFLYQDSRELVRREANIVQEFRYAGFTLVPPVLILGLHTHVQLDIFGRRFGDDDIEDNETRQQALYPYLTSQQPRFAIGTPSSLELLASFLRKDGFEYTFHAIQFRGEPMEQGLRRELSRVLKSRIIEDYGTRECSTIGLECSAGKLHLAPWVNYVEVVDENGTPLPPGSEGKIVVTYFENEVMPFIRYAIGDRGIISTEPCGCHRISSTVTFTGRTRDVIELPSGRRIPFLRIATGIAESFPHQILRFQLHQNGPTALTFRFVTSAAFSPRTLLALNRFFTDLLAGEATHRLERVDRIPPDKSGKAPPFVRT